MKRTTWVILLFIVVLAFLLRAGWALVAESYDPALKNNPLHGDASGYDLLARNLIEYRTFSWDGKVPTSYRMPGYPAFLSLIYAGTHNSLAAVKLLQALCGALTVLPVYGIARRMAGWKIGLLAAGLTALHPLLIYLTGWVYSETVYIVVLWVGLFLFIEMLEGGRLLMTILAGLSLGVATLLRPEIFPFPLVVLILGLILRWHKSRIWRMIAMQGLVLFIILPWSIRNTITQGSFILLTTSSGSNFYAGNNPDSQGGSAWAFPIEGMREVESDRELLQRGISWIRENPADALKTYALKLYKFSSPVSFETQGSPLGRFEPLMNFFYFGYLAVAAFGAWKSLPGAPGVVLIGLIIVSLLTALIFFGGTRVALPTAPALVIFALIGLDWLTSRMLKRDRMGIYAVSE